MTKRRKRNLVIVIVLAGVVAWQYGLFNRYTYLTAKIAILRDAPTIVVVGDPIPCNEECLALREKYGFKEKNFGTKATKSQLRGIQDYNAEIENYLDKKHGEEWRINYEKELKKSRAN